MTPTDRHALGQAISHYLSDLMNPDGTIAFDPCSGGDVDLLLDAVLPEPREVPDSDELPGMWEPSDLIGGKADSEDERLSPIAQLMRGLEQFIEGKDTVDADALRKWVAEGLVREVI